MKTSLTTQHFLSNLAHFPFVFGKNPKNYLEDPTSKMISSNYSFSRSLPELSSRHEVSCFLEDDDYTMVTSVSDKLKIKTQTEYSHSKYTFLSLPCMCNLIWIPPHYDSKSRLDSSGDGGL